jgi:hypothetical protein
MARSKNIENMSFAELTAMQARIEKAKAEKQSSERVALKQTLTDMAKKHGFDITNSSAAERESGARWRSSIAILITRQTSGLVAGVCRSGWLL